ncbi:coiled-coil domain-containing protein 137 [Anastrepha obliqua]|uniref:coiled-coil domain-containing protein 137 n=1 Tax=Anastrepha obliqua TaxID=95512 RepID=UPI002409601E|nr:coiled-coil domain-containing protein 137 [Anastrepha obliqua]XP_054727976.1 coiled-coil domain-containing protein 137 [Anastrepha obliqua]
MARKRKIPARKHHGVRDPLKQIEVKEKKLRKITNNPPERDNQQVSFKFAQFKKLIDDTKAGKKIKRIHKGQEDKPKDRSINKIGYIQQLREETDEDYLKRVNRITAQSLREAQYEAKYGVNVIRNPKTGEISISKKPKNEIDELLKEKQKKRGKRKSASNKEQDKPVKPLNPEIARELIKQAIKEDKEEKVKAKSEVEEYKQDIVRFGEVVHAPPTLSTLPRRAQKSETVPRPGKKSNLLLKSLLSDTKTNSENTPERKVKAVTGKVEKNTLSGKRKNLPMATRKMLEDEQSKFIEIYRAMKKTKVKLS